MTLALNGFYLVMKEKISFIKILNAEESGNTSERLFSQNLLSAWKRIQLSGKWNDLILVNVWEKWKLSSCHTVLL